VSNSRFSCYFVILKNLVFYTEGAIKKDNSEKLATYGSQDEDKQNKNTTQYVLDTTMRKQTQKRVKYI
jgi:hypothetical protein